MPIKLTYEFVKNEFEKENYILLSKKYINNSELLKYVCPAGHTYKIRLQDWRKGHRCPFCSSKTTLKLLNRIEELKNRFIDEGYILKTLDIENSNSVVTIVCPKRHSFNMKLKNWLSGNRCPYCSNRVRLKDRVIEIKKALTKDGYTFCGFENRKIKYICGNGHDHSVLWTDWQRGVRCPYCYGNNRKTIGMVRKEFATENYILYSVEYRNCYTKLHYICPKSHTGEITWNDWQQGCRCSTCANINNSVRVSGLAHPMWKGGISCEPYCQDWTNDLKNYIKSRDGDTCLNPYCFRDNSTLAVHHINYNKKDCSPDNLITICRSCNSRANKDRKWHKAWYQAIVCRRYSYGYN